MSAGLWPILLQALLPAVIAVPLIGALFMLAGGNRTALALAPWTPLPALILSIFGGVSVPDVELPFILMGTTLGMDGFSRVFLLFTALLWWTAGLHARGYIAPARQREFFGYFLAAMAGNLGLLIARDIVSFYTLYALMSFASYGLVIHTRSDLARYAGKVYLVLVVLGELLLFPAMVVGYAASGELLIADWAAALAGHPHAEVLAALLLLGFGIKAGALPLHVWLPLAHPAAPTPASAVLSGAMIKAGLFGICVFLPLGAWQSVPLGIAVMALSLAAAVLGAFWAIPQTHPKALLAYSSISKMGPMTFAAGAALYQPELWPLSATAILIFAAYHALTKGALFLSVGAAAAFPQERRNLMDLAAFLPLFVFAGFPITAGAIAKLPFTALKKPLDPVWAGWLNAVLLVVAFATVILLYRFRLLLVRDAENTKPHPSRAIWIPWLLAVLMSALLPVAYFALGWGDFVAMALKPGKWFSALPPLLLGLFAALAAVRWGGRPLPNWPAGDLLLLYRRIPGILARVMPSGLSRLITRPTSSAQPIVNGAVQRIQQWLPVQPFLKTSGRLEKWLMDGPLAGTLLLVLFLGMILALAM
jgi:formate hydrogenlyase subunit 3/multisubunit Na+/H+ antiporter MnhD subunit